MDAAIQTGTGTDGSVSAATAQDASSSDASIRSDDSGANATGSEAGSSPAPDAGGSARDGGVTGAVGDAGSSGEGGTAAAAGACTRESLRAAVDTYYAALAARAPAMLNASPTLKLTENGKKIELGQGLWMTAGEVRYKGRSALDVEQCETVTESVVDSGGEDLVVGLRLKLSGGQISEIESILVGSDGWFPNPRNVISSASDDWEKPLLAEGERWTREQIKKDIVDAYFVGLFGGTIKVADYPFASSCKRAENGFSPGACNFGVPTSMRMMPLHYVVDVEAGIGVGFVLFGSSGRGMLDFHMFKVKSGQVHGVRAVVGPSVSARGWP